VWELYDIRSTASYLIAHMKEEDFDKVTKNEEGIVLKIKNVEIYFLNTPVMPIIIYRGDKELKDWM